MTKTLATLIKVHQHAVDEQRRVVAELEAVQAKLVHGLALLKAEMATEKLISETDREAAERWPNYIQYALKREQEFGKQISALEAQIAAARDVLQEKFADLKKYEIAKDNFDADVAAAAARDERIEMDEIAGMRAENKKS
jgi:flagellar biosynthesis chaperone FliJ